MVFKSGQEMFEHIINNGLGFAGDTQKMSINSCGYLLSLLKQGEEIDYTFLAGVKPEKGEEIISAAWAVTNQRILIAKKKLFGEFTLSINIDQINDVTMHNTGIGGFGIANITIDTIRERVTASTNISYGETIHNGLHDIIEKNKLAFTEKQTPQNNVKSPVEQVKELKELLDIGILTQEEFEVKKKELLGL